MMQPWFTDAKLGIFIHWGSYAVGRRGGESWPIMNGEVAYDDYLKEMEHFTAESYDPVAWAGLFKRAGANYTVLTTKHHDGIALWPTRRDGPSIANQLPCGDLIGPYVEAVRAAGMKVGLYFSHTDWSNLDHFSVITGKSPKELRELRSQAVNYGQIKRAHQEAYDLSNDAEVHARWERFLDFHRGQIEEILTDYGPIDLIWFDVMMGRKGFGYPCRELREFIHGLCNSTVINSRLGEYGDYETPEQFIPVYPPEGAWELCITTNNTWSFTGREDNYKTPTMLIGMFCECLGMGGNMLLNVGPDKKGVIPSRQVALLEALGSWIRKHEEAVYGTIRGLPHGYAYHFSSLNKSRDTIFLYMAHTPNEATDIKGIRNGIKRISVLGHGAECAYERIGGAHWLNVPGVLSVKVPQEAFDESVTVLKIELDGALDLYGGKGVEIDVN
ncbi:MAG: alpha-L-fucosidase [Chitinivibrionales bacterium]|nr:alpha-L-fucosidase [Chitinivibrionales bacterium]MBD3356639.1 alpha-L-fucosidase [Chitinivibrionales bacterium]